MAILCADSAATQALGRRLGALLRVGDAVALVGALGAGKTTFVQGLAQGLGVSAEHPVTSPTFTLCHEHPGRVPLVHADLYRLRHPGELQALALDEALDRAAVVIEWADRFPEALPADHLEVRFTPLASAARELALFAHGPRALAITAAL